MLDDVNAATPQDSNASPVPPTSPVAGQSEDLTAKLAEMQSRLEQVEREKKGIYADLKAEREARRMLSQAHIPSSAGPNTEAVSNVSMGDPSLLVGAMKPVLEEVSSVREELDIERTIGWLAKKEGKDPEAVQSDKDLQKALVETAKKYHITAPTRLELAKISYDLLQRDRRDAEAAKKAAEVERNKAINANSTESVSGPAAGSNHVFTRDELKKMSLADYQRQRAEIEAQYKKGLIK